MFPNFGDAVFLGRSKKRWDDGTDDGTLSRPRICKPLYGPSQGDETTEPVLLKEADNADNADDADEVIKQVT